MKNIFKKNQVIITALAIMIAVAGYLNFTGDKIGSSKTGEDDYVAADTKSSGTQALDANTNSLVTSADVATGKSSLASDDKNTSEKVADKTDATVEEKASTDISEEDIFVDEEGAMDVSDTGEVTASSTESEDTTGEAVLANKTINSSFFSSSKLKREQTRAMNKETLMGIIGDNNISEDQKQDAVNSIIDMTAIAEKENATETYLEAKGYNSVVSIIEGKVNVIVDKSNITDKDIAVIEDIVKGATDITIENITITPIEVDK